MFAEERQKFEAYIKSEGMRETQQRVHVLDTFLDIEDHVSVDDLYRILQERDDRVGYATVHRTMKLICDCGLAREVRFDDGIVRYEHNFRHRHHHHLVCTRCREIIEFESSEMDAGERRILKRYGFKMESHRYEIFGLCAKCRREITKDK